MHFVPETPGAPYEYYVVQRRRTMVECNFALGHIGQIAAARDNAAVCAAACQGLLGCACAEAEPGAMYSSYMTSLRVTHSAICNLIRLASSPSSYAATPLVHGTPNNLVPGEPPPPRLTAMHPVEAASLSLLTAVLCRGERLG